MGRGWKQVFLLFAVFACLAKADGPFHALSRNDHENRRPEKSPDDLLSLFKKGYGDDQTYLKGACCDNVCRLVKQMKAAKLDLTQARVLYLLKQSDEEEGLAPQKGRQRLQLWSFHVVLELKGQIYDFDYSDEPTPVTSREYFTSMFTIPEKGTPEEEEKALRGISLRAIPATEYLADFGPTCDYDQYLKNTVKGRHYPAQSAWDFIGPQLPRGFSRLMVPYIAPLRGLFLAR